MHHISFASDEDMPEWHDFIFIQVPEGALIFYREGAVTPKTLEESWAAYRALERRPPVGPTQAPVERPMYLTEAVEYWRRHADLVA